MTVDTIETLIRLGIAAVVTLVVIVVIKAGRNYDPNAEPDTSETKSSWLDSATYGYINGRLVCPHCTVTGQVRTKAITVKTGISGGKAVAAILTGGTSTLVTGLSKKTDQTQAHCDNCGSTWAF